MALSRSVNKLLLYINDESSKKNGENATKSGQRKRELSDMLGPRWSKEELERFYRAYRKHGKDWEKIAAAVQDRSVEMVEALYTMNRAYLSLPKGHASAAGLKALMTDYYSIMEDRDNEQETIEPIVASQKPQKRARGTEECDESLAPDLLQPQSAASSYGAFSLLKKKRSGTGRQAAGHSTPFSRNMTDMPLNMPSSTTAPDIPSGPSTAAPNRPVQAKKQTAKSSSVPSHPLVAVDTPPTAPQHQPSTSTSAPASSAVPGQDSTADSVPDIDSGSRTWVTLRGDVLLPSGSCSRRMRKIFQKRLDIGGMKWKTVSQETKDFYFEEFKKYFYWDQSINDLVKVAWEKKVAKRYSDLVNSVKSKEAKPAFVSEAVWARWQEFWNNPDVIRLSAQNSKNRRGRDNSKPSCHTGGSVSYAEHAKRLAEQLGREPTAYEFFLYTHTKNHDGQSFVDDRSREINERILALREKLSQKSETIDENQVYYDAVGGERKRRVYGLGSEALLYYKDDASASLFLTNAIFEAHTTAVEQLEQRLTSLQSVAEQVQQQMASLDHTIDQRIAEHIHQMLAAADTRTPQLSTRAERRSSRNKSRTKPN